MDDNAHRIDTASKTITMTSSSTSAPLAQTSDLIKRLSPEVLEGIFIELGPAGRRLLGATCHTFYEIYKKYHFDKQIIVHLSEAATSLHGSAEYPEPNFVGTEHYQLILATWLCPAHVLESDAWVDRSAARRAKLARDRLAEQQRKYWYEHDRESKKLSRRIALEENRPIKENTSFRMDWYQQHVIAMARRHDGWYLIRCMEYVYKKGRKKKLIWYEDRHHGCKKEGFSMRVESGRGILEM